MSGTVDSLAPKRVRRSESPEVSDTQATAQAAQAFQVDWSGLPEELIPKIGVFLKKQAVMRLRRTNKVFRIELDASETIKRPLKEIRDDFKQEVGALTSGAPILPYMYDHVQELTGHTGWIWTVTQLTDRRIVSGSSDNTLRVWGYVEPETGDAS